MGCKDAGVTVEAGAVVSACPGVGVDAAVTGVEDDAGVSDGPGVNVGVSRIGVGVGDI